MPDRHPSAFTGTFAVVNSALRLLWRHWPVLLVLALAGFGARRYLVVLAAKASDIHRAVGILLFALVPLSMLVALVLMMRVIRKSLPAPPQATGADASSSGVFSHFASVLVPFLAVYAAYDYFAEDVRTYRYEILADEVFNNAEIFEGGTSDVLSRLPGQLDLILVIVVVTAIALRMVLGRIGKQRSHPALGAGRAYLEATWLSLSAATISVQVNGLPGWIERRQAVAWAANTVDNLVVNLGPLTSTAQTVKTWLGEILGSFDAVIIVPLAWLTIGCVVYGQELVSPSHGDPKVVDLARRRWDRLPSGMQKLLTPVRNDTRDRFGPMVRGFRLLKHAGLPTMLLFCLAFVVAQAVPGWLWELERLIIGPNELGTFWMPLSGPLSSINLAVGAMLTMCLVTAAVDYVLRLPQPDAGESEAQPAPVDPLSQPSAGDREPDEPGVLGQPGDPNRGGLGLAGHDEHDRRAVVA